MPCTVTPSFSGAKLIVTQNEAQGGIQTSQMVKKTTNINISNVVFSEVAMKSTRSDLF